MPPARKPAIDKCNACGKLFPRVSMRLCTACSLAEQNRFDLVREFLDAHGGGSVTDIAQQTGVSAVDVRRFLEGGRLVAIKGGGLGCTCGGVGERCVSCRNDLTSTMKSMHEEMARDNETRGSVDRPSTRSSQASFHRRRRGGE